MPETPRSSKRRRLNHSPELASTERSTRRSAKSTEDELYHVIEVTESPVYEVDSPRRSATKKATPLRQYTRKNLQAQKVPAASNPSTPTKSQAKSQRPPRSGLMSQGKTPARSTRRQRVGETVGGEEDELALPVEHELDELNVDPLGTELEDSRFGRGLRGPRIENATTDGNRVNGTPSKARKRLTPRKPVKEGAQESVDSEGDAMDVDNDLAGRSRGTNGIHATINGTSSPKPSTTTQSSSEQQSTLKNIVLSKLSQRRPIPLKNLDTEYTKVHQLLHATVTAGESNSLLLIGARGSGKTAIVNAVLRDLSRSQKEHFHTIRLNGFIQTDDKLALREIWRQLGREMEISDAEDGGGKSYADTLTMLLALLSHPDEIAATATDGSSVARSVIFIMDEFDLFATHARQTLLYNLLDIAQSRKAPIAVIGLTARIDVTEALEKRVKSRFSHRYVHLSLPKTLSEFVNVGKAALRVDAEDLTFEEKAVLLGGEAGTALVGSKKKARTNSFGSIVEEWNNAIEILFTSSSFLKTYAHPIYHTTKSIPTLLSSLLIPISILDGLPEVSHFTASSIGGLLTPPDSSLHILPSLSELALSLLIAAARLSIIHSTDTTNFPLAYAEYVSLASKARMNSAASGALASGAGTRVFGKEVARREWEKLVGYGLLVPVASGAFGLGGTVSAAGTGGAEKGMEMVRVDVALEEIPLSVEMSAVMEKWCLQI